MLQTNDLRKMRRKKRAKKNITWKINNFEISKKKWKTKQEQTNKQKKRGLKGKDYY